MTDTPTLRRTRALGVVFQPSAPPRPWAVHPETYWRAVPPPPLDVVTPATVPEPSVPVLVEDEQGRSMRAAADTYAATLCGYARAQGESLPMPVLPRSKSYAATCEAVRMIVRYRIAPAYWIRHIAEAWASMGRVGMPSWGFLLSPGTVRANANDALDGARAHPLGGRVVIGPVLGALLADYREMTYRLHRTRPRTDADVRAVVAEVFPHDAYARRAVEAQHEAQEQRKTLAYDIARGTWVW